MKRSLLVLVAVLLLGPATAHAYVRTAVPGFPDSCLYWDTRTIRWSAASPVGGQPSPGAVLEAFRLSFAEWERQSCTDLRFREEGPVARTVGYDQRRANTNTLLFRDVDCEDVVPASDRCWREGTCANRYDCWDYDRRLIAVTTTTFSQCDGRIVDADVELNAAWFEFTVSDTAVRTDVRNTLTHEIGHMIGLDHSNDRRATMYASAPEGELAKRSLAQDDVDGLCDIYPAGQPTWTCEPPGGRCWSGDAGRTGGGCGSAAGAPGIISLFAAVYWLARRRRVPGGRKGGAAGDGPSPGDDP